jgi:peptide/nickel transport system substrate-binding protein
VTAASAATLIALAVAGCNANASTSTGSGSSGSQDPVHGGNLTIGFDLNVENCLDPQQNFGLENRDLDRNLVDSLTDQNPKTGQIIPWLATSWSVNSNSTVFTFNLRKGVTFSNGQPLNAQAVQTSFNGAYKLGALSLLGITYLAGYEGTKVTSNDEVESEPIAPADRSRRPLSR